MNRLFFLPFLSRHRLAFVVLAFAFLTASMVSGRAWLRTFAKASAATSAAKPLYSPQSDRRKDRVEGEVITLLRTGFQPSLITRPRGQFMILVDNRTELDELTLRLDTVAGQRLREVRLTRGKQTAKQLEDLHPGEYLLTEAGHANWICKITITSD